MSAALLEGAQTKILEPLESRCTYSILMESCDNHVTFWSHPPAEWPQLELQFFQSLVVRIAHRGRGDTELWVFSSQLLSGESLGSGWTGSGLEWNMGMSLSSGLGMWSWWGVVWRLVALETGYALWSCDSDPLHDAFFSRGSYHGELRIWFQNSNFRVAWHKPSKGEHDISLPVGVARVKNFSKLHQNVISPDLGKSKSMHILL